MRVGSRIALGVLALFVVLAGGGLLYWNWVPLHRGSYVSADRAILTRVGIPPGATLVEETPLRCVRQDGAMIDVTPKRTIGYELESQYDLSRPMSLDDVLAFYRRRLAGWTRADAVHYTGSPPAWVRLTPRWYRRGEAFFSVQPLTTADGTVTGIRTYANAHDLDLTCFR